MGEAGLTAMIDRALSRLVRGSERGFLMILCVLCALLSAFMSNVATMTLVIPIAEGYCRAHERDSRSFLLPLAMSCLVGGSCTLIGSAPQLVVQGIMEELTGTGFGFFEFARIGTLQLGLLLLYIFLRFPTMEEVWNTRQPDTAPAAEFRPIVERRKFFLVTSVFLAALVLFYFEPIPLPVTSVLVALICIFAGCISSKRAVAAISPVVVVKLGASLCLARELNTATFAMALIFSSTALSTPLSATPLMMIMGERYRFSDYTRYGMAFDMITLLIAVFVVPLLYPIAF